jgi:hypothetical protein
MRTGVREEVPSPAQKAHTRVCGSLYDLFHNRQVPLLQATREMVIIRGVTVWMLPKPHTENIRPLQPHEHLRYGQIPWFSADPTRSIVATAHFEIIPCNINTAL